MYIRKDFMKNKKILILIMILISILVIGTSLFIILKNKKPSNNTNNVVNNNLYLSKVNDLLIKDNYLKKMYYSKVTVLENTLIINNKTYNLLPDDFKYKTFEELHYDIDNTYAVNYKNSFLRDTQNYNSYLIESDKFYVNIKSKCNIPSYDEKYLSIKNVSNGEITYTYENKDYKVIFKDDIYLIDSSPFVC